MALHNPSHHAVVDCILCVLFLSHCHMANYSYSILATLSTLHPLVTTKLMIRATKLTKKYRSHKLLPCYAHDKHFFLMVLVNFEIMCQRLHNGLAYRDMKFRYSLVHHASLLHSHCHHIEVAHTLLYETEDRLHTFQSNWTSQTIVSRLHQL